jgi:hypothetical protein
MEELVGKVETTAAGCLAPVDEDGEQTREVDLQETIALRPSDPHLIPVSTILL